MDSDILLDEDEKLQQWMEEQEEQIREELRQVRVQLRIDLSEKLRRGREEQEKQILEPQVEWACEQAKIFQQVIEQQKQRRREELEQRRREQQKQRRRDCENERDVAPKHSAAPFSLTPSDMLNLGQLTSMQSSITIHDFRMDTSSWFILDTDVKFSMESIPFGSGTFRDVYKASIDHPTFKGKQWVVKKYKANAIDGIVRTGQTVPEHTKKVVQMHKLARYFAVKLEQTVLQENASAAFGNTLSYRNIYYGKTDGGEDVTIEEYIAGNFSKYINNDGRLCMRSPTEISQKAECLCHYSYQKSDKELLLVDIQGSNYNCFDPEIACTEEHSRKMLYAIGNLGQRAIDNFIGTHRCNYYCNLLGLNPFTLPT